MDALRRTLAIGAADLRERMRSPRLWVVIALIALAMWWSFPPIEADYLTVSLREGERGRYGSAWIGMVVALLCGTLLSLAGFYLVRGTVVRDLETRVWQLLVATPMTRGGYLVAKWLSHLAVFALVLVAVLAVGLAVQLVRGEDRTIDLVELIKPSLLLAVPSLAVTATLAVWFDLVPWLRRTAGNVVYFFLWAVLLGAGINASEPGAHRQNAGLGDPAGIAVAIHALYDQRGLGQVGEFDMSIGTQALQGTAPVTFEWRAWRVSAADVAGRAGWVAIALATLLLATPLLDRFAAVRTAAVGGGREGRTLRWLDRLLAPLRRGRTGTVLAAELALTLRQRRRRWWLAMAVLCVAQLAASDKGLVFAIVAAWLVSLDVFARQGLRERDTGTAALVLSAPGMRWRLLGVRTTVAVLFAWGATLPAMLRLATSAPTAALATALAGLSIALWGLASAALCRNPRPFELALVAAGYAGVQGALVLDVLREPATTALWHAALLPVAAAVLLVAWPRLQRAVPG